MEQQHYTEDVMLRYFARRRPSQALASTAVHQAFWQQKAAP